tara:strand:+ start:1340 stop:2551 length:1212 start_codon:yes stop_codon:yes gene_type:complete
MNNKYSRYADVVQLNYLRYEERKTKKVATDYLKHKPDYLELIPEYSDDSSMLFFDTEQNQLIYGMRGLDFELIQRNMPSLAAAIPSGAAAGGAVASQFARFTGTDMKRATATGQMLGGGASSYLFGNKEVRSALDLMLGGVFDNKIELDEKTQQIKTNLDKQFANEYTTDLNREITKIRDIQEQFPNTELVLAGHSRSGAKASDLSKMLDLESYIFNPAETSVYSNLLLQMIVPNMLNSDKDAYDFGSFAPVFLNNETPIVSNKDAPVSITSIKEAANRFMNIKEESRVEETNPNINIFKTDTDMVAGGYSSKYNIQKPNYVRASGIENVIGQHSIENFISKEMFNSVKTDTKIEQQLSPPSLQQPVAAQQFSGGTPSFQKINPYYLCKQNPSLSFCENYIKY